jgi:hypothetical protein
MGFDNLPDGWADQALSDPRVVIGDGSSLEERIHVFGVFAQAVALNSPGGSMLVAVARPGGLSLTAVVTLGGSRLVPAALGSAA